MAKPKLLSGGNPQIPLGYGDGPVQDYIDAVHGSNLDRRLHLIYTGNLYGQSIRVFTYLTISSFYLFGLISMAQYGHAN